MTIRGKAFLQVRMEPATGFDFDTGRPAYTGPRELMAGFPSLLEAERTGDFEAILTWHLGLEQERHFRVIELQGPPRLVVDVAH